MKIKTFQVSELNNYIGKHFKTNPLFQHISVEGEVFNLRRTSYGYVFFSLKDDFSKIQCIMDDNFYEENIIDGSQILVRGKINVYEKNGTYSVLVSRVENKGEGKAFYEYQKIKDELNSLGFFDPAKKKKIPPFPNTIGLVTSLTGAAVGDMLQIIGRRYPLVTLLIYDTKVQGSNAIWSIRNGIMYFNNRDDVDLIIIARGGGSYDELSIFNDKELAIEIFNSSLPLISAVGHENDFFICDLVADLRAPTPSAAAELCVPDRIHIQKNITEKYYHIENGLLNMIKNQFFLLNRFFNVFKLLNPEDKIKINNKVLNMQIKTLENRMNIIIEKNKKTSDFLFLKLDTLNPIHILKKGYGVISKKGKPISDVLQIKEGDIVESRISNGMFCSKVLEIRKFEE